MTYQAYQWFVFQADLDPVAGHEQAGVRPVLVISADPLSQRYDVVSIVPLTSRKNNRLHVYVKFSCLLVRGELHASPLLCVIKFARWISRVLDESMAKSRIEDCGNRWLTYWHFALIYRYESI